MSLLDHEYWEREAVYAKARELKAKVASYQAEVDRIAAEAIDDEVAHSLEDDLRAKFIAEVAAGTLDGYEARAVAAVVLKTQAIQFARHCA